MVPIIPWTYPTDRYYYGWYGEAPPPFGTDSGTDGAIKSTVVDRLRENPLTAPFDLKVDVKQSVVVLGGIVGSSLAKRAAGDDAWDTPGVNDVSNQLEVVPDQFG
ncbi:MAG TPA: BON domain-containing protein [Acidimicrobiales bacterium]|nr:BON domain-containing protein [Acidimicrobiales bacterium]